MGASTRIAPTARLVDADILIYERDLRHRRRVTKDEESWKKVSVFMGKDSASVAINEKSVREKVAHIIFEADTPAGKIFDVVIIACIVLSVLAVVLESLSSVRAHWGDELRSIEWAFTVLFTIEYGVRLITARRALAYARSFYGIVDLLALLPTWTSALIPGGQYLIAVRSLRVLRVFRVFRLAQYLRESTLLSRALWASRRKILVFLLAVLTIALVMGSLMYLVEGEERGFDSIPRAMYWTIVTMTTVGYGDISPQTATGQLLASLLMILGYAIIAVPTGIVSAEIARNPEAHDALRPASDHQLHAQPAVGHEANSCGACEAVEHQDDARFCRLCGHSLVTDNTQV